MSQARELASGVLTAMEQDCGPTVAEPYSSWAKTLAGHAVDLVEDNDRLKAALRAVERDLEGPGYVMLDTRLEVIRALEESTT